jgi:hypothetical protein
MFVVAPVIAVGMATVGFVLANHYDDPPAQMTVALLCLLLAFTWLVRRVRRNWHRARRLEVGVIRPTQGNRVLMAVRYLT